MRVGQRVTEKEVPRKKGSKMSWTELLYKGIRIAGYLTFFVLLAEESKWLEAGILLYIFLDFVTVNWRFEKTKNIIGQLAGVISKLVAKEMIKNDRANKI